MLQLGDSEFWRRPLDARMADFAVMREAGPFTRSEMANILGGDPLEFYAVTRYAELVEISRNPADFCSGQGSISIQDMPAEALAKCIQYVKNRLPLPAGPVLASDRTGLRGAVHASPRPAGQRAFSEGLL